jgi:hypothetical protein
MTAEQPTPAKKPAKKAKPIDRAPRVTVTLLPSDDPRVLADHERLWDFLCGLVLNPEEDER